MAERSFVPPFLFDAISEYSPFNYGEYWDIALNCGLGPDNGLRSPAKIEGNSGDACRESSYPIEHYEIFGYGLPSF